MKQRNLCTAIALILFIACFAPKSVQAQTDAAGAAWLRGVEAFNTGNYDQAIIEFSEVIRLTPNYADVYYYRGLGYANKNDLDRAIADYTQAIRLNPNNAEAYNNRGMAYGSKRDYDHAIDDFEAALLINPNHANAKQGLEAARQARGR